MKKLLMFMLLLMSLAVSAETGDSLITVDWNSIKAEVRANPQRVQNLVDEFINVDSDLTMTAKDRILAVYGRTYLNNGSDMSIEIDMMKVRHDGKFEEAATIADRVLAKNPLNTNALISKIYYFRKLSGSDPDKEWMTSDSLKVYSVRLSRILDTIFMTGDGSKEHPFSVTSVGDEYNFVNFFLGILKINGQMMIEKTDRLILGDTSEVYTSPDIYFDIKRVLELEAGVFCLDGNEIE